jgi:hypothetical protein
VLGAEKTARGAAAEGQKNRRHGRMAGDRPPGKRYHLKKSLPSFNVACTLNKNADYVKQGAFPVRKRAAGFTGEMT